MLIFKYSLLMVQDGSPAPPPAPFISLSTIFLHTQSHALPRDYVCSKILLRIDKGFIVGPTITLIMRWSQILTSLLSYDSDWIQLSEFDYYCTINTQCSTEMNLQDVHLYLMTLRPAGIQAPDSLRSFWKCYPCVLYMDLLKLYTKISPYHFSSEGWVTPTEYDSTPQVVPRRLFWEESFIQHKEEY